MITTYFHCGKCLEELPDGVSPKEYARTQVGLTDDGQIQIWCNRHNCNVGVLDHIPTELAGQCCRHDHHCDCNRC
jgi:hypothetical protein